MITPAVFVQIKSIYQQKNSLLQFRVLRLQRELREARETLCALEGALEGQRMSLMQLRHELTSSPPGAASSVVRQNGLIAAVRSRLAELDGVRAGLEQTIAALEEAIPQCRRQEARNNIRCDYLADWVIAPQEAPA